VGIDWDDEDLNQRVAESVKEGTTMAGLIALPATKTTRRHQKTFSGRTNDETSIFFYQIHLFT
jgi:hypothetical protein